MKATFGTGSSLMMPTPRRLAAAGGLASTVAWGLDTIVYALEGNIYVTGAAVQWVADFAGLSGAAAVADMAASCPAATVSTLCRPSPAWAPRTGMMPRVAPSAA